MVTSVDSQQQILQQQQLLQQQQAQQTQQSGKVHGHHGHHKSPQSMFDNLNKAVGGDGKGITEDQLKKAAEKDPIESLRYELSESSFFFFLNKE